VRDGCPAEEIAIVARSLAPYAAALEEVLDGEGLVWASSLAAPLRRQPVVRDFLLLLRVLDERFSRRATAELLRSPRIDWRALSPDGVPRGDRADAWSRKARILGGLDEWTADLARWAEGLARRPGRDEADPAARDRAGRRLEDVRRIGLALSALDAALARDEDTWSGHAGRLERLAGQVLRPPGGDATAAAAHAALLELLADMGRLEQVSGDTRRVRFAAAREWLAQAADRAELPARLEDRGGLRVLDLMQARGLTFRRVHFLGLNAGTFPRPPRQDAVLPDAARRAVAAATARPLSIKAEGADEERLLLAQALGLAADGLDVSWQRAEESGRALTPSPALREIARWATGRPDAPAVRAAALHLPSHPEHWLSTLCARTGMLAPGEARLLVALNAGDDASIAALGGRFPDLDRGVRMLRATQSFEPAPGEYDGRVGPRAEQAPISVSAFERLGRCPLQFFFGSVLRVGEFDEQASALALDAREVGTEIHAALAAIYGRLREEGAFERDEDELVRRGLELLSERRPRLLGEVGARMARRLPLLGAHELARWHAALERFMRHDLTRIRREGWRVASIETLREDDVDLGAGVTLRLRGQFDRLLERDGQALVGDYKASTRVEERMKPGAMLSGCELQVGLYFKMAGPRARVELLPIHPEIDPESLDAGEPFAGFGKPERQASFDDTLRTLVGLWRGGTFPFREGDPRCDWCAYGKACRRTDPPSKEREEHAPDAADFHRMVAKSTRNVHGA
jgi:ATP-dependent helicase/nuclease subunit B